MVRDLPGDDAGPPSILEYRIELRDHGSSKILAYAAHASLAHAVYGAAKVEHPDGVIVICRGDDVLARSDGQ